MQLGVRAGAGRISGVGGQTFRVYERGWWGSKGGRVGGVLIWFSTVKFRALRLRSYRSMGLLLLICVVIAGMGELAEAFSVGVVFKSKPSPPPGPRIVLILDKPEANDLDVFRVGSTFAYRTKKPEISGIP